jgi:hypothetical protein
MVKVVEITKVVVVVVETAVVAGTCSTFFKS